VRPLPPGLLDPCSNQRPQSEGMQARVRAFDRMRVNDLRGLSFFSPACDDCLPSDRGSPGSGKAATATPRSYDPRTPLPRGPGASVGPASWLAAPLPAL